MSFLTLSSFPSHVLLSGFVSLLVPFLPAPSPFDIGRAAVFIMFACFVYNVFLINLCLYIFNLSFCSFLTCFFVIIKL